MDIATPLGSAVDAEPEVSNIRSEVGLGGFALGARDGWCAAGVPAVGAAVGVVVVSGGDGFDEGAGVGVGIGT